MIEEDKSIATIFEKPGDEVNPQADGTSQEAINEGHRLRVLQDFDLLDTPQEEELDDLTWMAAHLCDTPIAAISLVDRNRNWFKSKVGLTITELPRADSFCHHALRNGRLFVIPDSALDQRFAQTSLVTGSAKIRFYAGSPLTFKKVKIGMLCVLDRRPRTLTRQQERALLMLADQSMAYIESRYANRLRLAAGRLPPGIHDFTLADLRPLVCTNAHRRAMWTRFLSFLSWPILSKQFSYAFLGGGFVTDHERPRDIDLVLETVAPYGSASFAAVSRYFLTGLDKIHQLYSVHLQFWMKNAPPGMSDYRSFFQYVAPAQRRDRLSERKGIVRIDLRRPNIISQFQDALDLGANLAHPTHAEFPSGKESLKDSTGSSSNSIPPTFPLLPSPPLL